MPIGLIWRDQGLVFHCTGIITGSDIIQSNEIAYADSRWPKALFQLVDLEVVSKAIVSDAELEQAAELEKKGSALNHDAKLVVIKPRAADHSVSKLVTAWFMEIQDQVTFSIRFAETMEEANAFLSHAASH